MGDVGRRFRATRVIELDVVLDEADVADQIQHGETAYESAILIAGSTPIAEWSVIDENFQEVSL